MRLYYPSSLESRWPGGGWNDTSYFSVHASSCICAPITYHDDVLSLAVCDAGHDTQRTRVGHLCIE